MATRKTNHLTRRQFIANSTLAAIGLGFSTRVKPLFAAQMGQKRLVMMGGRRTAGFGNHGRSDTELTGLVDAGLAGQNPVTLERIPLLAEELPSVKKGTWKIDRQKRTMVTVYRLRSGLKWSDGKPHTSHDFKFGWEVHRHPEFPLRDRLVPDMIDKIETPDDRTIAIHWKTLYNEAHAIQKQQLRAWPRHILQDAFIAGDIKALVRDAYWNQKFIGAGPYRLLDWGNGDRIEVEANPYYAIGKPKIDRVTYRVVEDSNTALSAMLAGEVDFALRDTVSFDGALVLKEQWEAKGLGTVSIRPITFRWLNLSGTNPLFKDVRVKRALLHAIDRNSMVNNIFRGVAPIIHFPLSPFRKAYPRADQAAMKYEYNVDKARQLLSEAGFTMGSDGVLVNAKGERMEFEFRTEAGSREDEQAQAIIVDYWKKIGVRAQIKNLAPRVFNSEEFRNRWPGAALGGQNLVVEEWAERFHSAGTPTAENRWATESVSLWRNAQADKIMDELNTIIPEARAIDLQVEFVKLFTRDLPYLPLYYRLEWLAIRKGLTGITPRIESGGQNMNTWNIHLWDKT
ncbi:MAG TPA: peptide ABC transporter substrate-binding protein [Candidatus Limnocylindrales bacterium]|nr:peptide ABC transporter substrate-binding protein [Candidatus Limnocylindrales bacterium]